MKEKYYRVAKTISRWKIDTPFENWLGSMADKSEFWKRVYVFYYWLFDHEYYVKGMSYLLKEIKRQKPNCTVWGVKYLKRDMIYSLHRFGASFDDYFIYKFFNLNTRGRESFNTLKMQYGYCEQVNGNEVRELFEDKGKCYEVFKPFYKRDVIVVRGLITEDVIANFIQRHNSFIYKPLDGHSGMGIQIMTLNDPKGVRLFIENHKKKNYILEELISQSPAIGRLHPSSINTLRILTFKQKDRVNILGAALRIGVGGASVDNAGAGGIYGHIDIKEGIIDSVACDNSNGRYLKHPDTKVVIPGFVIPEWEGAKSMVFEMAQVVCDATVISWDLAYSTKGWCMVEGNDVGDFHLYQVPYNTGFKHVLLGELDTWYKSKPPIE